jgi:hypothetical protein
VSAIRADHHRPVPPLVQRLQVPPIQFLAHPITQRPQQT